LSKSIAHVKAHCLQLLFACLSSSLRLHQYVQKWQLPHSRKKIDVSRLFAEKAYKANVQAETFKCDASQGLSLLPILIHFVHKVLLPSNRCNEACLAFLAFGDVVDLVLGTQVGTTTATALENAIVKFFDCCKNADWEKQLHSKFHWILHFPQHLRKWGFLPSCFVLERKHRMVKRYAQDIRNTGKRSGYELSVLTEVVCHTLAVLPTTNAFNRSAHLEKRCAMPKMLIQVISEALGPLPLDNCFSCSSAKLSPAGSCSKNNIVMLKSSTEPPEVCAVIAHIEVHGVCFTLANQLELLSFSAATWSAKFCVIHKIILVPTEEISQPLTCRWENTSEITVLFPCWIIRSL